MNPAAALKRSGGSGRSDAETLTAMLLPWMAIPAVGVEVDGYDAEVPYMRSRDEARAVRVGSERAD